jgi:potassium-transporting ATPase KdpC subunit
MVTTTTEGAQLTLARQARTALLMVLMLTVICGILYPLVMTGAALALFPTQANGSLVRDTGGNLVGSTLIAQSFSTPAYFHPRPSAAGTNGYDPTSSGASNLGPTNPSLTDAVSSRADAYRQENGVDATTPLPADAVTASASGLDPDISPANALLQLGRVAAARGMAADRVRALVNQYTQGLTLGILGEPRVNVLQLNRALDDIEIQ